MAEKDAATVLEEAADLLLIRGVERGEFGREGGPRCVLGALAEAAEVDQGAVFDFRRFPASAALDTHLRRDDHWNRMWPARSHTPIPAWNDSTEDDFEVIDTLRHVAKDLRNEAEA